MWGRRNQFRGCAAQPRWRDRVDAKRADAMAIRHVVRIRRDGPDLHVRWFTARRQLHHSRFSAAKGEQMWQRWVRGAVNGALAVGTGGLTFVASLLRTDRVSTVFDAYDSLGRLRWTDTSSCGIMSVAANSTGRVAAAGGKLGALATMLLAPRLAITEPPDQRTRKQALSVQACPSVFADLVHLQVRSEPSRFVSLRVFDRSGRLVRNLGDMVASSGVVDWDGRDEGGRPIGSGVYFVRVESFAPGAGNADKRSTAVVKVTKVGGCSLDKRGGDAMTKLQ